LQSAPSEAQRLVFMSWPGEQELEKQKGLSTGTLQEGLTATPVTDTTVDPHSLFSQHAARTLSQPPKAVREDMRHRTTIRQLG
jgi:hypothetical protein